MSGPRSISSYVAALAVGGFAAILPVGHAVADSEPYVGEEMIVPYNFCPVNFLEANGALLAISEYDALFTLYGTTFGGDGVTTFALPDLRGRLPIHLGTGPGLSNYVLGQTGGTESFTLSTSTLPSHTHLVQATNSSADSPGPGGKFLAADTTGLNKYHEGPANKTMNTSMIGVIGSNIPVAVQDPYLTMRVCVATFGVFPSPN